MQDLHLVGFTKDHRHLIFSTRKDAKSGSYVVPVDDDLVEAVQQVAERAVPEPKPDPEPPTPRVESQLSVREVQARLRGGDAVADVAADAGVEPDWVERFAAPIRAEQRRIVDRALTVPLTRARAGESAVPLRRAVAAAMAERGVEFSAEGFERAWSARLIGGDDWVVTFEFPNRGRKRQLEWAFDLASETLTTTDRFASQLAFVESAKALPPASATVGAQPTRTSSAVNRGALTSGGLARPGSGRVTTPSGSASPMPPVVRPAPTRSPETPQRPAPPRPIIDQDPIPDRAPTAEPQPHPEPPVRRRDPERSRPPEPPQARQDSLSETERRSVFDRGRRNPKEAPAAPVAPSRERQPAPAAERPPRPGPVPARRPAPVAAATNATRSFTRRPVPEVAERMPVTVDDDQRRRGMVVEDRHALDNAVTAHPPGRGESVVILRSVVDDEPDEVLPDDEFVAEALIDDDSPDVDDESYADENYDDENYDDWDDSVEDDSDDEEEGEWTDEFDDADDLDHADEVDDDADEVDDADAVDELETETPEAQFSITLNVPDDGDAEPSEPRVERAPIRLLRREKVEEVDSDSHSDSGDVYDDADELEDFEVDDEPDAGDDYEDAYEFDDEEFGHEDESDDPDGYEFEAEDEDLDDDEPEATPRRSTIQIRPGSATQARRSANGRRRPLQAGVDAAPASDEAPDTATPDEEDIPPPPPRRRRREPLRAR